jgi:hypothetical protein
MATQSPARAKLVAQISHAEYALVHADAKYQASLKQPLRFGTPRPYASDPLKSALYAEREAAFNVLKEKKQALWDYDHPAGVKNAWIKSVHVPKPATAVLKPVKVCDLPAAGKDEDGVGEDAVATKPDLVVKQELDEKSTPVTKTSSEELNERPVPVTEDFSEELNENPTSITEASVDKPDKNPAATTDVSVEESNEKQPPTAEASVVERNERPTSVAEVFVEEPKGASPLVKEKVVPRGTKRTLESSIFMPKSKRKLPTQRPNRATFAKIQTLGEVSSYDQHLAKERGKQEAKNRGCRRAPTVADGVYRASTTPYSAMRQQDIVQRQGKDTSDPIPTEFNKHGKKRAQAMAQKGGSSPQSPANKHQETESRDRGQTEDLGAFTSKGTKHSLSDANAPDPDSDTERRHAKRPRGTPLTPKKVCKPSNNPKARHSQPFSPRRPGRHTHVRQ